jgi:hypothetical protein
VLLESLINRSDTTKQNFGIDYHAIAAMQQSDDPAIDVERVENGEGFEIKLTFTASFHLPLIHSMAPSGIAGRASIFFIFANGPSPFAISKAPPQNSGPLQSRQALAKSYLESRTRLP